MQQQIQQEIQRRVQQPGSLRPALVFELFGRMLVPILLSAAVGFVVLAVSQGATIVAVSRLHLGRPIGLAEALSAIRSVIIRICAITVVVGLGVGVGLILLIVPGILLVLGWSLAIPVTVLEGRGIADSLARSWRLTVGRRGAILLIFVLFLVLTQVLSALWGVPLMIAERVSSASTGAGGPFQPAWAQVATVLASFVTSSLVSPLATIALSLVYYDQRVRKEAFDLQHLMAGLDGGGSNRPASEDPRSGGSTPVPDGQEGSSGGSVSMIVLAACFWFAAIPVHAAPAPVPITQSNPALLQSANPVLQSCSLQSCNLDLEPYLAELDRLLAVVSGPHADTRAVAGLLDEIPSRWIVRARGRLFTVSTHRIRGGLEAWRQAPDRAALSRVTSELQELRAGASSFEEAPVDVARERAALDRILAKSEFRAVHGPTWLEGVKQQIRRVIYRLLGRVLPTSGPPAMAVAIVVVLSGLTAMLIHRAHRRARAARLLEATRAESRSPMAGAWTAWLADARAAAAQARWRDAIHLAYWCGIAFLETKGLWRPDRARTPREYLRLLPPSNEHHPALALMTRELERVWYGRP